ncbi:MAG: NUDIX domain-containing protein [Dysgonamonadaceae bacterium]|jgi:8-oxo-dGTP pyrophosphatase MutT (NUDIX family)|nr:NUDIX domain-containing protein [Dysgonamonadaceae bacterium]
MDRDIKIYFNDRVVVLTDKNIKSSAIDNDQVNVFENKKVLAKRLERFEESDDACLYISHPDPDELFEYVVAYFQYMEAAGGLVTRPNGHILMIKRHDKWDLPKGKAEKGESLQETAIREVMEECGLKTPPKITGELAHTFHTYHQDGNRILKHTAWYAMRHDGGEILYPQLSENITSAVWLPQTDLNIVLQNTYESIKQVMAEWLKT